MKKLFALTKYKVIGIVVLAFVVLWVVFYNPLVTALQNSGVLKKQCGGTFVEVLDVGEADAILLCNNGKVCLVDTGDSPDSGRLLINKLNSRGITKIDALVLTHPHSDHAGGLFAVLNEFEVENFYYTNLSRNNSEFSPYFESILSVAKENGTKSHILRNESSFTVGDIFVFVPFANGRVNNLKTAENDKSAVLFVYIYGKKFLLMADAGYSTETYLVKNYEDYLKCDVLKVAHHGSNTACSKLFLKCVNPQYAAISCGSDNTYNHPNTEVLRRLENAKALVFRTDINGDIKFIVKNNEIYVE